ncbi:MAG TPA: GNAT family N-acetyltransferase [Streptosporangiaceae bacterium]|nr:GNAT family N-acetyltransferase [Streptosporangiaceae bacterium]
MSTEIRMVKPDEMADYLKVLPYANGLPHWEPFPAAWHAGPEAWPQPNAPASPAQLEAWADEILLASHFHPQAAFADGRIVGGSAMISFEITVPGNRQVPLGGVTSTAVVATHRRRGLLRQMMQAMLDEARERGEPLAGLSASEGSIYGRYGYGPATRRTRWEIERTQARFRTPRAPDGSLEITDAETARHAWRAVHDTVRVSRAGELSATPDNWSGLNDTSSGPAGPLRYLVHRDPDGSIDGVANYRLPWSPRTEEAGTLVVEALQAASDDAYHAMWQLLLDFDLTRKVVAAPRPSDEPLRWMLDNPRAMRVTRQSDSLWIRLLDVRTALQARAYDTGGTIVLGIDSDPMCPGNEGSWRLDGGPDGAVCTRVTTTPDLMIDLQALGSLYLGGMSAALLASAGRIHGDRKYVNLLSRMFRTDPEPFNTFVF